MNDIKPEAIFKALSDPTRIKIIKILSSGERCVCKIFQALKLPQPKVSRHLAYLRKAGLVTNKKQGLWQHYSLNTKLIKELSLDKTLKLHLKNKPAGKVCSQVKGGEIW